MHDIDATIRLDPTITTADGLATPTDIHDFHAVTDAGSGNGVTVAIMDSGIDATHPVFDGTTVRGGTDATGDGSPLTDRVGHGTGVAGLVALLAPDVELVSVRIFGDSGRTNGKVISQAYQWLIEHADEIDLVNMSWGAQSNVPAINKVHSALLNKGVQDVAAAGNTGGRGGSPATQQDAFGVGAVTEGGQVTRFSSYNPERDNPDVSALGKDVALPQAGETQLGPSVEIDEPGPWIKASGTSFAAPITAGLVARWWSTREQLTDPVGVFERTSRDIVSTPEDGEGIVDYTAALAADAPERGTDATVFSPPWSGEDWIHVDADTLPDGQYTADVAALREAFERDS